MTQTPPGGEYDGRQGSHGTDGGQPGQQEQTGWSSGSQGPYGGQPGAQRPRGSDSFFEGLRRLDLRRSDDDWIGGVASGLAERLGVDPLVIRALFVVLALGMGVGVFLYLAAWLLIPDRQEQTHIEKALRMGDASSVFLLVVTVISLFGGFGWAGGGWWTGSNFVPWSIVTLVLVGLGGWWLWSEWNRREHPGFYSHGTAAMSQPAAPHPGDTGTYHSDSSAAGGATAWTQHGDQSAPNAAQSPAGAYPVGAYPSRHGAPSRMTSPDMTPQPRAPRRPGRRSAGVAGTMLAFGLALLAAGGLGWAAAEYGWAVNPWLVGLAGALGVLGLAILILGITGRTSGFPGFLAIVALVATLLMLPLGGNFVASGQVGDYTWTPSVSENDTGPYRVGAGTGTLDLRRFAAQDTPGEIEGSVGFGQLTIVVPDDLTVRIEAGVGVGSISREGPKELSAGLNVDEQIVIGDGPVDLTVRAHVGVGEILVEGEGR